MSATNLVRVNQVKAKPVFTEYEITNETSQSSMEIESILRNLNCEEIKIMSGPVRNKDEGYRVIPITLHTGETMLPDFNELQKPEAPAWSAFLRTGREKEIIVPINITEQQADYSTDKQTQNDVNSIKQREVADKHSVKHEENPIKTTNNKTVRKYSKDLPPKPPVKEKRKLKQEEEELEAVHKELKIVQDELMTQVANLNQRIPPKEPIPRVDESKQSILQIDRSEEHVPRVNRGEESFLRINRGQEKQKALRSRSLDNDSQRRKPNSRKEVRKKSYGGLEDKSMEEIDKEIALIWKELQDLDSLPTSPVSSKEEISSYQNRNCEPVDQWQSISRPSTDAIYHKKTTSPSHTPQKIKSEPPAVANKSQNTIWDLPPSGVSSKVSQESYKNKCKASWRSRRASLGNLPPASHRASPCTSRKMEDSERNIVEHLGNIDGRRRRKSDEYSYAKTDVEKEKRILEEVRQDKAAADQTNNHIPPSQRNGNPFLIVKEGTANSVKNSNFILTDDNSLGCDACTQTDRRAKKNSCALM